MTIAPFIAAAISIGFATYFRLSFKREREIRLTLTDELNKHNFYSDIEEKTVTAQTEAS